MLHLPEYVFPACMLVFGYPTDQQVMRPKPERCSLEDIVQENTYRRRNGQELRKMFAKKYESKNQKQTYEQWIQAFCKRKYNSDFAREMSRSVERYLVAFADREKK